MIKKIVRQFLIGSIALIILFAAYGFSTFIQQFEIYSIMKGGKF